VRHLIRKKKYSFLNYLTLLLLNWKKRK